MHKRFPKAKRIIRKMEQITRPHFTIIASEELLIVFRLHVCEPADRGPNGMVLLHGRIQRPSYRPYRPIYRIA